MIHHQRCLNHPVREAVARCPVCREHFCRECITEHEDKIICASCLRKQTKQAEKKKRDWSGITRLLAGGLGFLMSWMVFYGVGRLLLRIPSKVHDGTIWQQNWMDEE